MLLLYPTAGTAQRLLLVGVGKAAEVTRTALRRAAAVAGKRARTLGATTFAFAVAPESRNDVSARDLGQVVAEGTAHGAWIFNEFKQLSNDEPRREVAAVDLVVDAKESKDAEAGRQLGAAIAAGAPPARTPPMEAGHSCTPPDLAPRAGQLGQTPRLTLSPPPLGA